MKNALRIVVVLAVVGVVLFLVNEANFVENKFASWDEVKSARPGSRAGIPEWLPPASTQIHHLHNLDTSKFMVRFEMPEDTKVSLPDSCRKAIASELLPPSMSRDWWPKDMPPRAIENRQHAFYQCADGRLAAISKTQGYVWTP